jgi:hypothetical protein
MSCRAHAALWIAGIALALFLLPLAPTSNDVRALEERTQALLAHVDPRIAAAALSRIHAIEVARAGEPRADRRQEPSGVSSVAGAIVPRWRSAWRIVVLRLALLACAGVAWVPMVVAGAVDGLVLRRARGGRLAAASPVAVAVGCHALIALGFAPVLWAALPLGAEPLALAGWALALAGTLSFTLSRAGAGVAP